MNGESQKILSGNFEAWCYQTLAGINYDPDRPGFRHIILRPRVLNGLSWVRASHDCVYGPITSDWKIEDGRFHWTVSVPPNTTATAWIPASDAAELQESGIEIHDAAGVSDVRSADGGVVVTLGSGTYRFTAAHEAPAD